MGSSIYRRRRICTSDLIGKIEKARRYAQEPSRSESASSKPRLVAATSDTPSRSRIITGTATAAFSHVEHLRPRDGLSEIFDPMLAPRGPRGQQPNHHYRGDGRRDELIVPPQLRKLSPPQPCAGGLSDSLALRALVAAPPPPLRARGEGVGEGRSTRRSSCILPAQPVQCPRRSPGARHPARSLQSSGGSLRRPARQGCVCSTLCAAAAGALAAGRAGPGPRPLVRQRALHARRVQVWRGRGP